ncbi:MAG: hypothetical protein MUF10_17290 [Thermoanaerobaculaceae bacterium]|jgi:hypothetical protein|nr:hypothetical protein [Thermoanaerobaculaceae bacterium]
MVTGDDPEVAAFLYRCAEARRKDKTKLENRRRWREGLPDKCGFRWDTFMQTVTAQYEKMQHTLCWRCAHCTVSEARPRCWKQSTPVGDVVRQCPHFEDRWAGGRMSFDPIVRFAQFKADRLAATGSDFGNTAVSWLQANMHDTGWIDDDQFAVVDGYRMGAVYEDDVREYLVQEADIELCAERWFVWTDRNDVRRFRQVDGIEELEGCVLVYEIKRDVCQAAIRQLRDIYLPLAEAYFEKPANGVIVAGSLLNCDLCELPVKCRKLTSLDERFGPGWGVFHYEPEQGCSQDRAACGADGAAAVGLLQAGGQRRAEAG